MRFAFLRILRTRSQVPPIDQVRLCLVSGGKFAERVPKELRQNVQNSASTCQGALGFLGFMNTCLQQELVARQLVLGVLDVQLAEGINPDAMPEIEFAYDGDVFRFLSQPSDPSADLEEPL